MSAVRTPSQWIAWGLLVPSIIIVWALSAREELWEPCADPARLVDMSGIPMTLTWEHEKQKHSHNPLLAWVAGEIEHPSGAILYQVTRSDQGINDRLNWHLRLHRIYQPESTWVEDVHAGDQTLPIHWSRQRVEFDAVYLTARMDYLGMRPTGLLLWDLLQTAPGQVLFGTLAITSYVVELRVEPEYEAQSRAVVREWLEAVALRNREVCMP